jgi:hypothetical protein
MTPLTEQGLHEAAMAQTGLSDFGDTGYLTGLRVGLRAVMQRPPSEKLNELFAKRALVALIGRLYTEASWREHPDYRNTRIVAPIMITGMSRSGTSALHQLLAVDPQFQWVPHWIAQAPTVRPPREQWPSHPLYAAMTAAVEAEFRNNPAQRATHNIEAGLPEECINMMCQSFVSMMFVTTVPLPLYFEWLTQQDETDSYRRYADVLRLIGASAPAGTSWLLKNPSHTFGMAALLEVFPDARVIVTHRDPVAAVSSGTSLTQIVSGDLFEPGEAGRLRTEVGVRNMERLHAARQGHDDQFHDVLYREFMSEPLEVVHGIYRKFELTLSPGVEAAMRDWIANNPQGKFGKHRYTPDELQLDTELVRTRFADYIKRFRLDS